MSATPREVGTLVVVILKAQHLPNKQRIGKQDPYCCVTLNGEKRRTRAIKRGGQHPEWDEEVRFTLFEDTEDILARTASDSSNSLASTGEGGAGTAGTPPPPPPKEQQEARRRKKKVKGGNAMHIACFADDPKEPELIGETLVDLTEVLTKGETDEWFTLTYKDKFAGEVYLELTFWSNEKPPEKKDKTRMMKPNKQYGGPGSFVPSESDNSFGSIDSRSSISSSLRPTSSLAHLDLYRPPYEETVRGQSTGRTLDQLADEFGGLNVGNGRRRESYPPPRSGHTPRPNSTYSGFSTSTSYHSNGYGSEGYDSGYDNPTTPVPHSHHHRHSFGEPGPAIPVYQSPYDANAVHSAGFTGPPSRSVSSMYSVPSASSGFTQITTPTPSGFAPMQTGNPVPSGFMPPSAAQTPVPTGYPSQPSQTPTQYGYGAPPTHTPGPSGFMPPHSAMGYHQLTPTPVQTYSAYQQYPPLGPAAPASAPLPTYPQASTPNIPTPPHSAPPQQYVNAPSPQHAGIHSQQYSVTCAPKTPSPPQQYQPPAALQSSGSRPLPTPGQKNGMHPVTPPQVPMQVPPQGGSPSPSGRQVYVNTPPHMQSVQHFQQTHPQPQQTYPLAMPPGPPSQPQTNAMGLPPATQQQNGFMPPPPPPPLTGKLPGPPPAPPVQVYHQQSVSDPFDGRGNSPTRPPLPQPPSGMGANGSTNGNGLMSQGPPPARAPSMPSMIGSVFNPPPPPPPLPNRRVVSTPHHPLPQPPGLPPPMPNMPTMPPMPPMPPQHQQAQRCVKPGDIFNPGPPPRPPAQVAYEIWHPPPQAQ